MKKLVIVCVMILSYAVLNAQNKISGKITDQDNLALMGVSVFISDFNKGTVSDDNGTYELSNLPNGKVKIQFSIVGFSSKIETVELNGNNLELNVRLMPTAIEIEAIVVTGGFNSTQHENAVKIDILRLDPHTTTQTPNFTEMLTKVPGIDMISKGSGVSKPVIRGLSMNDILVLNNGVRFENYQYSSHHPLGIDEFGIESVEIIKGPASLLYGSDAIGGVLNFIKEKPAPIGSIIGDYNMQLFSNSLGMTNNLGIKGASKNLFGGLRVGQKTNADFLQGGGAFVPNSRFNEMSLKANAGFTDKIGTFKLFYDFNNQKLGLVEDEAIEAISQRGRKNEIFYQYLNTHLLSSQNKLYLGTFKLDINSAFQNTELAHLAELGVHEIQMQLSTLTYDVKLHLPTNEISEYIVGFQGFNQANTNLNNRETKLLPDAITTNYSAFGLLQYTFIHKLKVQTGIRYDFKTISTNTVGDMNALEPLYKNFGSFSGSFGTTYNVSEKLLVRLNFASAYRTPNLAELTSNGQHELRYEIGDPNLIPENSYEVDISTHYHKDNYTFDIAGFYNAVNNFIFLSPTNQITSNGLSIYRYKQSNSALYGGEAGLHIHPKVIKWLHFETTFSSVIAKQQSGQYLPFIPANKLRFELRAEKEKWLFFKNPFASVNSSTAFNQNNPAPDETSTPAYTLIDLSIGGNFKIGNQLVSINLSANNVLDTKYIDHLSTLKELNFYNPGRNISVHFTLPFGAKTTESSNNTHQ